MTTDRRISDLPLRTVAPDPTSEIVVNEPAGTDSGGNRLFTTTRVALNNLSGGGGEIELFTPMQFLLANSSGQSKYENSWGAWGETAPQRNLFTTGTISKSLPASATHFLIFWFSFNNWSYSGGVGSSTSMWRNRRQYAEHNIVFGGATQVGSGQSNIKMTYCHNVCYVSSHQPKPNDAYYSSLNKQKTKLMKIDASDGNISINGNIDLIMGGNNAMSAYMGDCVILPIKTTDANAFALAQLFDSVEDESLPNYDMSGDPAEANRSALKDEGNELRRSGKHLIDVITDFLVTYDGLESGDQPTADEIALLEDVKKSTNSIIYSSKKRVSPAPSYNTATYTLLTSAAETQSAMDDEYARARTVLAVPFVFEQAGGIVGADIEL